MSKKCYRKVCVNNNYLSAKQTTTTRRCPNKPKYRNNKGIVVCNKHYNDEMSHEFEVINKE